MARRKKQEGTYVFRCERCGYRESNSSGSAPSFCPVCDGMFTFRQVAFEPGKKYAFACSKCGTIVMSDKPSLQANVRCPKCGAKGVGKFELVEQHQDSGLGWLGF